MFDNRVAVDHSLNPGDYDQCHACRLPITEANKLDAKFEKGVSCPRCYGKKTESQRNKFRERQRQVDLAREQGFEHIGSAATDQFEQRREQKISFKEQQRRVNADHSEAN